jgi:hypothetical protein
MLIQLLLEILKNRPIISLMLSFLSRFPAPSIAQPQRINNTEIWEVIRSPEGRIENIIIHRNVVVNGEERTQAPEVPLRRVMELE